MDCIRTGIIGFGKMGLLHGALVNTMEGMELVAICEKTFFVRQAFKTVMPAVKYFSDYKKMIDKCNLNAVVIATPTFNHYEIAEYAANKGIAVFIEKPLSLDGESATRLSALFEEKQVPSLVGFSNRFFPTIAKGKELMDEKIVGDIVKISSEMYIGDVFKEESGWRYDPSMSGGGALIDFGIHMVDLLVWYFGDIKSLKATTKSVYSKNVEDEAQAEFEFANGLKATFETSWSNPKFRKSSPKITVEGALGTIVVTEQTIDIIKDGKQERIAYPDLYKGDYVDIAGINYTLEMKAFYQELQGKHSGLSVKQGAYVQKIVDKMYESAKTGLVVEVL